MGKKRKRRRSRQGTWLTRNGKYLAVVAALGITAFVAVLALDRPAPVTAGTTPRPIATVDETAAPEVPSVQIIGDSYTGGSAMNSSKETLWASLLGTELGVAETILGFGGIGYVAKNAAVGERTYVTETQKITAAADVVVFFGSRNDDAEYIAVYEAAAVAYAAVKAKAPKAELIVVGPPWVNSNPPANVTTSRDAVRDAAKAAGAVWIDPLTDGWFTEGNAALIGTDGVHPTDQGHAYIAEKLRQPLIAALAP